MQHLYATLAVTISFHNSHKSYVESMSCTEKCSLFTLFFGAAAAASDGACYWMWFQAATKMCQAKGINLCNVFFFPSALFTLWLRQSYCVQGNLDAVNWMKKKNSMTPTNREINRQNNTGVAHCFKFAIHLWLWDKLRRAKKETERIISQLRFSLTILRANKNCVIRFNIKRCYYHHMVQTHRHTKC